MIEQEVYQQNQEIEENKKTPSEIRELIQASLVENRILGYLNNNILYMKSFGRDSSPDKILISIGIFITLCGLPHKSYPGSLNIFIIGIIILAIGAVVSWLIKHYLVYDIDREVFYSITNFHNTTLFSSKEVARKDIIELGVDVTDKNEKNQICYGVLHPKKGLELIDNPGLKTSFVALNTDGKKVYISDPVALREPHEVAVARCQLFSDCFGVKSVICNKNETLKIEKDANNNNTFTKFSKDEEWKNAVISENRLVWIILITISIGIAIIIFLL